MWDVFVVHRSGASASDFSPSRLLRPVCPCQMLFLHLLVFQPGRSLRPDAPGGELETKVCLGSCSVYFLHPTSEGQCHITSYCPALYPPCWVQIPKCCWDPPPLVMFTLAQHLVMVPNINVLLSSCNEEPFLISRKQENSAISLFLKGLLIWVKSIWCLLQKVIMSNKYRPGTT